MISHKTVSLSIKLKKEKITPYHEQIPTWNSACIGWDIQPPETKGSLEDENSRMTGPKVELEKDFIPM